MPSETIQPVRAGDGRIGRRPITVPPTAPVHQVLESLFDRPSVGVNEAQKVISTTQPAADGLLSRQVKLEALSEMTGKARHRRCQRALHRPDQQTGARRRSCAGIRVRPGERFTARS